jgi:hypothetical protein
MEPLESVEEIIEDDNDDYYDELEPEEFDLAKKKLKTQKLLYIFMLGLLSFGTCILIVYQYQNNTFY